MGNGSATLFLMGAIALTCVARVRRLPKRILRRPILQGPSSSKPGYAHSLPTTATNAIRPHAAANKKLKGGLYLDTRDGLLKGGDNGPAIVAGSPPKAG